MKVQKESLEKEYQYNLEKMKGELGTNLETYKQQKEEAEERLIEMQRNLV